MTGGSSPRLIIHPGLTDQTIGPVALARHVAARGLAGIYLPEHTHIPVDYVRSDYPIPGAELPGRYKRLLDPYTALAFVSATESGLEVGTCVSLLGQHDPVVLAKATATLDLLSGGKLVMCVGFGWSTREFDTHRPGLAAERPDVVAETAGALRCLWRDDVASFDGKYVQVPPAWSWPKPSQRPGPPLVLGARGTDLNFRRIADWADGWITMAGQFASPSYSERVAALRSTWEDAGRDPADLTLMALYAPGTRDDMARAVDRARSVGVSRLVLHVEDRAESELLEVLDDAATASGG